MKSVSLVLLIGTIAFGCTKEQRVDDVERWEEVQFKVALRSEGYEKGESYNSGEFEDLFVSSLPIRVKNGPGEAHLVADGIWVHVAWDNMVVYERLNQLGFEGFRRRIDNRFQAPYGKSWMDSDWRNFGDVGISTEWDCFETPVGIDGAPGGDPRRWCKMWRWTPRSSNPDIMLGNRIGEGVGGSDG